ncbi:hypothetical protein KCU83_g251, partial [Aureobasidium melanogenum]
MSSKETRMQMSLGDEQCFGYASRTECVDAAANHLEIFRLHNLHQPHCTAPLKLYCSIAVCAGAVIFSPSLILCCLSSSLPNFKNSSKSRLNSNHDLSYDRTTGLAGGLCIPGNCICISRYLSRPLSKQTHHNYSVEDRDYDTGIFYQLIQTDQRLIMQTWRALLLRMALTISSALDSEIPLYIEVSLLLQKSVDFGGALLEKVLHIDLLGAFTGEGGQHLEAVAHIVLVRLCDRQFFLQFPHGVSLSRTSHSSA